MLFCDAICLPTRPSGAKEGVLVAWGYDETGRRVLLDVVLGQRERFEDWLEMGRALVRRGLRASMLVVTDGAPGLIRAIEDCVPTVTARGAQCTAGGTWPASCRRTTPLHERMEAAYWTALDEATSTGGRGVEATPGGAKLERSYPGAGAWLAEDLAALCVHLEYPLRLRKRLRSTTLPERSPEEVKRRTKRQLVSPGNRPIT